MFKQKKSLQMLADVYGLMYQEKDYAFLVERTDDKIRLNLMIYDVQNVYLTETVFEKDRVEETFTEDIKEVARLHGETTMKFYEMIN